MSGDKLQQQLFQEIKASLPGNISFVDEIADLLQISPDSAYRRIRGDKSLSFEELKTIARHFRISLDNMLKIDSNSTVFYGKWLEPEHFKFEQYLSNILMLMKMVNSGDKKLIYYEAKDFPPFHYYSFPELAAFKHFFWMKTILNYSECNKMSYEDNNLGEPLQKVGAEIIKTYSKIPSVEIWSLETINSTLHQIRYYQETGVFLKKESIETIFDQLSALLNHVKDQAEAGEKLMLGQKPYGGPPYQLYFNDAYLGHNTSMTEIDGAQTVYINHGVLNLMQTHDKDFCQNTRRYFENTMKKSALISTVNDRERNRFFRNMQEKVSYVRNITLNDQKDQLGIWL